MTHKLIKTDNYLLVVDDSVHPYDSSKVGNPLAHLPLNGSPILEGVDLLPPYHQEDGVEELAEEVYGKGVNHDYEEGFIDGYNKSREKYKYTEEDVRKNAGVKQIIHEIILEPNGTNNTILDMSNITNK